MFVGLRICDLFTLLSRLYLGRKLSAEDFGAIDAIVAFVAIFGILATVVFQISAKSLSRLISLEKKDEHASLVRVMGTFALAGGIVFSIVLYIMRGYVLARLHLPSEPYIYALMLLVCIFWGMQFCIAVYQGGRRYRMMISHLCGMAALTLIATLVGVRMLGASLSVALYAVIVPSLAFLLVFTFIILPRTATGLVGSREELRLMRGMFLPMIVYLISLALLVSSLPLFIRNFLVEHSGGYSATATLGIIPSHFIYAVVFVVFPLAAAEHAAGREVRKMLLQGLAIGLCITLVCVGLFAIVARPLLGVWRADFLPYAKYVWLQALAMGLHGMIQVVSSVEMARHRYSFLWVLSLSALGMCIFLYAIRNSLSMPIIFLTLLVTHVVALLGVWLCHRRGTIEA